MCNFKNLWLKDRIINTSTSLLNQLSLPPMSFINKTWFQYTAPLYAFSNSQVNDGQPSKCWWETQVTLKEVNSWNHFSVKELSVDLLVSYSPVCSLSQWQCFWNSLILVSPTLSYTFPWPKNLNNNNWIISINKIRSTLPFNLFTHPSRFQT